MQINIETLFIVYLDLFDIGLAFVNMNKINNENFYIFFLLLREMSIK